MAEGVEGGDFLGVVPAVAYKDVFKVFLADRVAGIGDGSEAVGAVVFKTCRE